MVERLKSDKLKRKAAKVVIVEPTMDAAAAAAPAPRKRWLGVW